MRFWLINTRIFLLTCLHELTICFITNTQCCCHRFIENKFFSNIRLDVSQHLQNYCFLLFTQFFWSKRNFLQYYYWYTIQFSSLIFTSLFYKVLFHSYWQSYLQNINPPSNLKLRLELKIFWLHCRNQRTWFII